VKNGDVGRVARALYRCALATRRARPRRRTASFGPNPDQVGRIYVINLERQTKRWREVQRELTRVRSASGAPFLDLTKRVAATDARYPVVRAQSLVEPSYTLADQLRVDSRLLPADTADPADVMITMSPEEVAIAVSHITVWEQIASGTHEYCLILEDDVYFRGSFATTFDRAWSALLASVPAAPPDLLFVSYEEALAGAEWKPAPGPTRRPIRGLWQLSGYVLSKGGAARLLGLLPVRGPVDLWINAAFGSLDVFALRRPMVRQRLDVPSSNFYSAVPVLTKVGLLTGDKAPTLKRRGVDGLIIGIGAPKTGLTSLAMAMSMLKYRCCSDVDRLPENERAALFGRKEARVFDAYVNVGTLRAEDLVQLADIDQNARFIVTAEVASSFVTHDAQDFENESGVQSPEDGLLSTLLRNYPARCLVLPNDHPDKWRLLTEFLGVDYPSDPYPECLDQSVRNVIVGGPDHTKNSPMSGAALRWDSLPWIVRDSKWHGLRLTRTARTDDLCVESFTDVHESRWLLRDDTFSSNLALFSPSNFSSTEVGAGRLTLRSERTVVRDYTSAALSTRDRYRYGTFSADLRPTGQAGLISGMFLHRNSPRQEIDIEFVGRDTTKLLVNTYYNPGTEGSRMEYGYRGTPELIDLGFDAAEDFHRYQIDWTPEQVQWKVDGQVVVERAHWAPTPIPNLPMQFHINLWLTRSTELAGRLNRRRLPAHTDFRRIEVRSAMKEADETSAPSFARTNWD
jgi:GR25 family glycosyltransferase involved in LPS biosynthesis